MINEDDLVQEFIRKSTYECAKDLSHTFSDEEFENWIDEKILDATTDCLLLAYEFIDYLESEEDD